MSQYTRRFTFQGLGFGGLGVLYYTPVIDAVVHQALHIPGGHPDSDFSHSPGPRWAPPSTRPSSPLQGCSSRLLLLLLLLAMVRRGGLRRARERRSAAMIVVGAGQLCRPVEVARMWELHAGGPWRSDLVLHPLKEHQQVRDGAQHRPAGAAAAMVVGG